MKFFLVISLMLQVSCGFLDDEIKIENGTIVFEDNEISYLNDVGYEIKKNKFGIWEFNSFGGEFELLTAVSLK